MNTANVLVNWVGPMNVFLGLYVFVVLALVYGVVWAVCEAAKAFARKKAKGVADAEKEAQASVGADATPSVELRAEDKFRSIESLGCLCPAGAPDRIVEDFFSHDQECLHACREHPGCQLAH